MHDQIAQTASAVSDPSATSGGAGHRRSRPRLRRFCRDALSDAAAELRVPVDALLDLIDGRRGPESLAAAAERFVAAYFHARAASAVRRPGLKEERPLLDEVLDRFA